MKMKKIILAIALVTLVATVAVFTGCVRVDMSEKNGPITTQTYDYSGFTGIEIGSAMQLEVIPSASYNVTITAGKNIIDDIRVSMSGDVLKIETDGWHFSWWWRSGPKVTVNMPELKSLDLSGATNTNAVGFKSANDFRLKISGASEINMDMETGYFTTEISGASSVNGRLTADGSNVELSGASKINLTGAGGDLKLHGSGASQAFFSYYTVNNADVELSGASSGDLDVQGRLDVDLSGASHLRYSGNPAMGTIDVSGASDLDKRSQP
jgi:uncharacterized protein YdeI (BOF family)